MNTQLTNIEIFKTGKHTATSGQVLNATPDYLQGIANNYQPAKHESPAVVGHPKHHHPAYGWVKSLTFDKASGTLYANFDQVEPQFAQLLKDGRFKKRSASFYDANHPANPTPGKPYLRHVGFLGAAPPAVKGLKDFSQDFSDEADCPSYEFSEFNDLLTNEERTMSEKDKQTDKASQTDDTGQSKDFAEREAQLSDKEAKLKAREDAIAAKEKALAEQKSAEQKKAFTDFADTLIGKGKISPAEKDAVVNVFIDIDNSDKSFDFAEDGKVSKKSSVEVLKDILGRTEPVIDFSERSASDTDNAEKPSYGDSADKVADKLDAEIQEFAEKNNITYAEAAMQF